MNETASPNGRETARILLDIKAVNFRPEEPYIFTSGWASPVYIDCRKLISFTDERRRIIGMLVAQLEKKLGLGAFDMVAGGETAGIPYAAWVADAMSLPMLYIRKKPKGFGRNARIEGDPRVGARVLLMEDLATDGASKLSFVDAIKDAGMACSEAAVVFYYGIFKGALDDLSRAGLALNWLATWHDVLAEAEAGKDFPPAAIEGVRRFLDDPVAWSLAHGGKGG